MAISELTEVWYVFPVAVAVSVIAIGAGVGGGLFFVPFFSIALGFGIEEAIGTAIVAQMVGAMGGTIGHGWRRTIDWKYALLLVLIGAPGVVAGFFLGQAMNPVALRFAFVGILLVLAVVILRRPFASSGAAGGSTDEDCDGDERRLRDRYGKIYRYCIRGRMFGVMAGFLAGTSVGLAGLGGGEINTPSLGTRCGMPLRVAISTSTCIMVGTGLVAAATRLPASTIVWPAAIVASAGTILGSHLGGHLASRASAKPLVIFLFVVFVAMAAMMFVQAVRL